MSDADRPADVALLDARGLICPLPVIRTQNKIKTLPSGALLDIVSSDRGALHDIPAWCRVHGHEVVDLQQADRDIRIRVRVHRPS